MNKKISEELAEEIARKLYYKAFFIRYLPEIEKMKKESSIFTRG